MINAALTAKRDDERDEGLSIWIRFVKFFHVDPILANCVNDQMRIETCGGGGGSGSGGRRRRKR